MVETRQIVDVPSFLHVLFQLRLDLTFNKDGIASFYSLLLKNESEKNLVRKYILELIQNWKYFYRNHSELNLHFWFSETVVLVDLMYLCKFVYADDIEIATTLKRVLLNEDDLNLKNQFEVEQYDTFACMYGVAYQKFSKEELGVISAKISNDYPWLMIGILSKHNWTMAVEAVKEIMIKTTDEGDHFHLQTLVFLSKDRLTKEQVMEAANAWGNHISEWQKKDLDRILKSK